MPVSTSKDSQKLSKKRWNDIHLAATPGVSVPRMSSRSLGSRSATNVQPCMDGLIQSLLDRGEGMAAQAALMNQQQQGCPEVHLCLRAPNSPFLSVCKTLRGRKERGGRGIGTLTLKSCRLVGASLLPSGLHGALRRSPPQPSGSHPHSSKRHRHSEEHRHSYRDSQHHRTHAHAADPTKGHHQRPHDQNSRSQAPAPQEHHNPAKASGGKDRQNAAHENKTAAGIAKGPTSKAEPTKAEARARGTHAPAAAVPKNRLSFGEDLEDESDSEAGRSFSMSASTAHRYCHCLP